MTQAKPPVPIDFRYLYSMVALVLVAMALPAVYFFFPSRQTYFLSLLYNAALIFGLVRHNFKEEFSRQLWKNVSLLATGSILLLLNFLIYHDLGHVASGSALFSESSLFYLFLAGGIWIYALISLYDLVREKYGH